MVAWYPDSLPGLRHAAAVLVCLLLLAACGSDDDDEDSALDALVLSQGTLTPEFDSDTLDYTAEVANDVASVTVTPTAARSSATVQVNGTPVASGSASAPIDLAVGVNDIEVLVTADNGTDQSTYTVEVTRRAPPSDNAALLDLTLSVAPLDQIFDGDQTSYTASAGFLGASTRVIAVPEADRATIEVAGVEALPGEPSESVALVVGDNDIDVVVTAEDEAGARTYSVRVTRSEELSLQQEAYVKASNTGQDAFGSSLGLSGDTLAVGAPEESSAATGIDGDEDDDSQADAGAVYVYDRSGSTWMQSAYVKPSNTGDFDRFGSALAIHGDLLAASAPGEDSLATGIDGDDQDDSGNGAGAVYLFERDGMNVWFQSAYVKASNTDSGDEFGIALAVHDGRVIVGAHQEDSGASGVDGDDSNNSLSGAGAAYVFARDGDEWQQQAYLKASNPDSSDGFGSAVAISGNLAAVGAPLEDSGATGANGDDTDDSRSAAGAVYVFTADDGGTWAQTAYLKASNTDAGDQFGAALALDGNLLAVGAPGENSAATGIDGDQDNDAFDSPGAVYVFERDADGDWSQIAYVKASNTDSLDGFGTALALRGNVLVVGAPGENSAAVGTGGDEEDDSALNAGAVYVFERDGSGLWSQIAYAKASNTQGNDELGTAVAFDGDTLVAGAPLEDGSDTGINGDDSDNSLTNAGAAYVIR